MHMCHAKSSETIMLLGCTRARSSRRDGTTLTLANRHTAAEHSTPHDGSGYGLMGPSNRLPRTWDATQRGGTLMSAQSSSVSAGRKGESMAMELSPRAGLEPGGHTPCRRSPMSTAGC